MHGRYVAGLVLLTLGALFILDEMGRLDFGDAIGTYWPLILIIVGIVHLASNPKNLMGPLVLFLLGGFFLLMNLGRLDARWWGYFWPLLLIVVGLGLLLPRRHWMQKTQAVTGDRLNRSAVLGGFDERVSARPFRGGNVSAFMGGGKLDLRDSELAPEGADVDVFAMMGGIEILVPPTWAVEVGSTPILGGVDNKATKPATPGGTLRVRATAILGGVEIKN